MKRIAQDGSEPARFAFEGVWAVYTKIEDLDPLLRQIVRYPAEGKAQNMARFHAQFQAWKWYCGEAIKQSNQYLLNHSVSNLILFAGRLVLAYNEVLYPYHKWFLRVLAEAPEQPDGLMGHIDGLLHSPTAEHVAALDDCLKSFCEWGDPDESWPNIFIRDSELNWMTGNVPVGDI